MPNKTSAPLSGLYVVDDRGCWIWLKRMHPGGYGCLSIKGKEWLAHRYSYTIYREEIPKGLFVLHTCDVPRCINPDHLFLGTQADNMKDKDKKGRHGRTGKNPLTEDEESFIFTLRALGKTHKQIADILGVHVITVGRYLRRERSVG